MNTSKSNSDGVHDLAMVNNGSPSNRTLVWIKASIGPLEGRLEGDLDRDWDLGGDGLRSGDDSLEALVAARFGKPFRLTIFLLRSGCLGGILTFICG